MKIQHIVPEEGHALVIKNKEGKYYAGGSWGYWCSLLNAKQYTSTKGLMSSINWSRLSKEERSELQVIEVEVAETGNHGTLKELERV